MKFKSLFGIVFILMPGILFAEINFEYTEAVKGYLLIRKEVGRHLEFKLSGEKLQDCFQELAVMQGNKKEGVLYKVFGKNNLSSFLFTCHKHLPLKNYHLNTTRDFILGIVKIRYCSGESLCMTKDIENLKYEYKDGKLNGNFEINVMNVIKGKLCFEAVAKDNSVEVKKMGILSKKSDDIKDALIFFDSSSSPK